MLAFNICVLDTKGQTIHDTNNLQVPKQGHNIPERRNKPESK